MSSGEKTEEATPRQLEKARERGEVSQSRDLTNALLLAVAAGILSNQVDSAADTFAIIGRTTFETAVSGPLTNRMLLATLGFAMAEGGKCVLPLLGGVLVMALMVPFLQVGPLVSLGPLTPKFSKINPMSGLKRLVSLSTFIELIKSMLKVAVVGTIFWLGISKELRNVVLMSTQGPSDIARRTLSIGGTALTRTIIFFLFIALLDFLYQRWQYKKNLRMSKEQVKQEYKEQEGDPDHKAHRKRLHEELSQESMLQHARTASAVVTNPDHLACAIRYDPKQEDSPRLLAKGKNFMAERIREIAKEKGIPVVRDISLAHALYAMELETQIPEELFDAVAEVLKWVETVLRAQGETPVWLKEEPPDAEQAGA